jgi:hypothetical protein
MPVDDGIKTLQNISDFNRSDYSYYSQQCTSSDTQTLCNIPL